jgi:Zn-finger nucleic acid-binding protein
MNCTVCRVKLKVRVYEGTLVQECPSCKGLFVEHETLARIARDEIAPRDEDERHAAAEAANGRPGPVDRSPVNSRRCSTCGKTMARYTYAFSSAVVVDGCPEHGIWLDAGEIEQVEAWAEAERRGMIQAASRHIAGYDSPSDR